MKKVLLPWLLLGGELYGGVRRFRISYAPVHNCNSFDRNRRSQRTQQFTATGNYSDGSIKDLTTVAEWSTSNVETITVGGLATGVTPGATVQINAVIPHGEIVGFATLKVTTLP